MESLVTRSLKACAAEDGNGELTLFARCSNCTDLSERAPSIVWQFMWNFFFGPYLIWKIRMIHDIYQWRFQTILAIVAG